MHVCIYIYIYIYISLAMPTAPPWRGAAPRRRRWCSIRKHLLPHVACALKKRSSAGRNPRRPQSKLAATAVRDRTQNLSFSTPQSVTKSQVLQLADGESMLAPIILNYHKIAKVVCIVQGNPSYVKVISYILSQPSL